MTFERARGFIYRNARSLDLARWRFHFEGGSRDDVLKALSFYRNEDGGFGHGLEADLWNPNSTPISVWAAAEIILETGLDDRDNELISGILGYLQSGADFDETEMQWLNTVPSNNTYPHAIWWEYRGKSDFKYNPTAMLAGFIILFAAKDSPLYKKACDIIVRAVTWFMGSDICEQHVTHCFIRLYQALEKSGEELVDLDAFGKYLCENVNRCICCETDRWDTEYVCKPSNLGITKDSIFYEGNEDICQAEVNNIRDSQLEDGSYNVTWQWYNDYKEFDVAANFWRSNIIIEKMLFLKAFE